MQPPADLRAMLWEHLDAEDLIPGPDTYAASRAEIGRGGEAQRRELSRSIGEGAWRLGLAQLGRPNPEDDCARILGFGRALTGYAVAPVNLSSADVNTVTELGALANLIVATFDGIVDAGRTPSELLSRVTLDAAFAARQTTPTADPPQTDPSLISRLVATYAQDLEVCAASESDPVLQLITRAIEAMYDAELAIVKPKSRSVSRHLLRRKAALPFVVMGLPAWLLSSERDEGLFRWHIHWLYRLGRFFGWIDDVVDLESDLETGAPSQLVLALENEPHRSDLSREIARAIALQGRRLMHEWRTRVAAAQDVPLPIREAVPTCLVSWFGGLPLLESRTRSSLAVAAVRAEV